MLPHLGQLLAVAAAITTFHFPYFVYGQYYDYQTRGVGSQDCPEDEFQLRALECECSLIQPTPSPNNNNNIALQQEDDRYQQQRRGEEDDDDYYYTTTKRTTTTSTRTPVNPQRVILGCLNIDGNKLAQLLRRIAASNYAVASLTLENAQLRGTRWLPFNVQIDDELTIRNSTLGDQSLDELSNLGSKNSQLKRLTLNHVGLTRIPRLKAAQAERLSMLNVEDNQITALTGDDFQHMPSLQALHLSRNQIHSIDGDTFSQTPLLANLQLDGNQLESLPSGVFRGNTQLGQLSLRANRFKTLPDDVFEGLANALYHLNLAENQLESLPPAVMSQLAQLEGLNVGSNRIRDFRLSPEMSHLRTLEVSNNSMSALPAGLEHMSKLEQLVSNNNHIRVIPKLPPALKNLQYVSLYQSGVEHVCPEAFQNVPSVQHIHLDGHNLTTIPRSAFAGVTPLALSLGSNRATLICDCRIAWLTDWIEKGVLQYPDYVVCAGPSGSEMENQPLNRIVTTLQCPYASDSERDVPPECHNNEEDTPYYPGSRARYDDNDNNNNNVDSASERERQLQEQLNRAQPNLWPSYVHSNRQVTTNDNNNNDDGDDRNDQQQTYYAQVSPTQDRQPAPANDNRHSNHGEEQQEEEHRPSINGYGHGTDDENEAQHHRHQHGPGITTERVDPNDVIEEGRQRQRQAELDEEGRHMHHAGSAAGHSGEQHQQEISNDINTNDSWRNPDKNSINVQQPVDDDNKDDDGDDASASSTDSSVGKTNNLRGPPNSAQSFIIISKVKLFLFTLFIFTLESAFCRY